MICLVACVAQFAMAQPKSQRNNQQQAPKSNANNITTRAKIGFPTTAACRKMWCGEETSTER